MKLVERWFAELATKWLGCNAHRDVAEPISTVQRWVTDWNDNRGAFV